jgi:hypothetical protein
MEQIADAAVAVLAAVVTALAPAVIFVGKRYAELLGERAMAEVQSRLGAGASRIAGEIAAEIRGAPGVQAATREMLDAGAHLLAARFADTVERRGVPVSTLRGMVVGELGKLGVAVRK